MIKEIKDPYVKKLNILIVMTESSARRHGAAGQSVSKFQRFWAGTGCPLLSAGQMA